MTSTLTSSCTAAASSPLKAVRYVAHCEAVPLHDCSGGVLQDCGTWLVSGYLRGRALSVNSLVHIPGLGDFQMAQVRVFAS